MTTRAEQRQRTLRPEKTWRSHEGRGFDSRHLHCLEHSDLRVDRLPDELFTSIAVHLRAQLWPRSGRGSTDPVPVDPRVIEELVLAARHATEQYSNNDVKADHGRLKARLQPMRGPKTIGSLRGSQPGTRSCKPAPDGQHLGTEVDPDVLVSGLAQCAVRSLAIPFSLVVTQGSQRDPPSPSLTFCFATQISHGVSPRRLRLLTEEEMSDLRRIVMPGCNCRRAVATMDAEDG